MTRFDASLTVPVPLLLREAVEQCAFDLDRSKASVVREALREYVTRQESTRNEVEVEPVDHVAEKIENERKAGGFEDHDRIGEHR